MKLLNVRLNEDDARLAAALRQEGVELSRVVRNALHAEYERRIAGRVRRRSAAVVMAEIYAACPDPPRLPRRSYDLRDRRAARRAIVSRLRRRRP